MIHGLLKRRLTLLSGYKIWDKHTHVLLIYHIYLDLSLSWSLILFTSSAILTFSSYLICQRLAGENWLVFIFFPCLQFMLYMFCCSPLGYVNIYDSDPYFELRLLLIIRTPFDSFNIFYLEFRLGRVKFGNSVFFC